MNKASITFISCDNMARSIVIGSLTNGCDLNSIYIVNRTSDKLAFFNKNAKFA